MDWSWGGALGGGLVGGPLGFVGGGLLGGDLFGSPSAPATPDLVGAARETSRGNLELEKFRTESNRFDEFNPYGSRTWFRNGDQWTSRTNLTPEQQALFNQEQQNAMLAGGYAGQALEGYNPNINWESLPQRVVNPGQTAQDAIMARLAPQLQRAEDATRARLANQGITLGSEAYGAEMSQLDQARNDALMQAALQGINVDQAARNQALSEEQFRLNQPLGLFQALAGGGQATVPQFGQGAQMGQVAGPDLVGAQNAMYQGDLARYNAQIAQRGQLLGGLFSLGAGALAGGYF